MKKLNIIYEDKELIVIEKPSGILTVSDGKSNNTLYHEVREYLNKKKEKVFIVHRLDKDTSGIILFAKSEKLKHYLQDNWENLALTREYYAVVEGIPKNKKDTLVNFLNEDKFLNVYVSKNNDGKKAITEYEVIDTNKKYSYLKINIKTGRKNQIRCQLAYMGNPICGDKKYGSKTNPVNRLALHATKLVLNINGNKKEFVSPLPDKFAIF